MKNEEYLFVTSKGKETIHLLKKTTLTKLFTDEKEIVYVEVSLATGKELKNNFIFVKEQFLNTSYEVIDFDRAWNYLVYEKSKFARDLINQ